MLSGRSSWVRWGVCVALVVMCLAVPALAQQSDDADKPWLDVPALEFHKPYIQWIVGTLFVAGCLLVAFKNPHRSHLD